MDEVGYVSGGEECSSIARPFERGQRYAVKDRERLFERQLQRRSSATSIDVISASSRPAGEYSLGMRASWRWRAGIRWSLVNVNSEAALH